MAIATRTSLPARDCQRLATLNRIIGISQGPLSWVACMSVAIGWWVFRMAEIATAAPHAYRRPRRVTAMSSAAIELKK